MRSFSSPLKKIKSLIPPSSSSPPPSSPKKKRFRLGPPRKDDDSSSKSKHEDDKSSSGRSALSESSGMSAKFKKKSTKRLLGQRFSIKDDVDEISSPQQHHSRKPAAKSVVDEKSQQHDDNCNPTNKKGTRMPSTTGDTENSCIETTRSDKTHQRVMSGCYASSGNQSESTTLEEPHIINIKKSMANNDRLLQHKDNPFVRQKHEKSVELEYGDGLEPLSKKEIRRFVERETNQDLKTKKAYVYVESSSTGRFFRYAMSVDQCDALFGRDDDEAGGMLMERNSAMQMIPPKTDLVTQMTNVMRGYSYLFRGFLAGFSCQTLYEVFVNRTNEEFIVEYSRLANETRRFYFIAITICLMGAIHDGEITHVVNREKLTKAKKNGVLIHECKALIIIACFLLALVFSLLTSKLDAELYKSFVAINSVGESFISSHGEKNQQIQSWKMLTACRSVCCIMCWLITNKIQSGHMSPIQDDEGNLIAQGTTRHSSGIISIPDVFSGSNIL